MILCAEHPHDIVHREVRLVIRKLARDEFVEDAHSKQLDGRLVVGEDIAAAGVLGEALRHGGHHLGIARIRELRAARVKGLLQRVGIGAENLSVSVARDVGDIRALEDARHRVAQILVERPFSREVMFRFTTMTPSGLRCRETSEKNSTLES